MLLNSILAAAMASVALAQNAPGYGAPATLSPDQIAALPIQDRNVLCTAQSNTCMQLCGTSGAYNKTCDPTTLEWTCLCVNGKIKPDLAEYAQSVPAQLCTDYVNDCVAANATSGTGSAQRIAECQAIKCGTKTVSVAAATPTFSSTKKASSKMTMKMSMTMTTNAQSASAAATSASSSPTSTGAAAILDYGNSLGTGALAAGVLALFGFAL